MKKRLVVGAVCVLGLGVSVLAEGPARVYVPEKWCSLGTSITWYNSHVAPSFTKGYQTRVLERIKFKGFVNRGVNGGCVSSAIGSVVPADVYTVEHGINDWGHCVKPGTLADYEGDTGTGTFAGGYRKVIDAIRKANPKAKIVLCTPRKGYGFGDYLPAASDLQKPGGYFLKDYADVVRAIAAKEAFPVADFFANCGENDELKGLSIDVALHPNDAGYQRMADELLRVLLSLYPGAKPVVVGPAAFTDDGKPKTVVHEGCIGNEPQVVLSGIKVANVTVEGAKMGGGWIPGGPFASSVRILKRDAATGTFTCQIQVRPEDNATRVVCLEFSQDDADVVARVVWSRYSWNWPVGVDFAQEGHSGNVGTAASLTDPGYVVSELTLGLNKADSAEAVAPGYDLKRLPPKDTGLAKEGSLTFVGNLEQQPVVVLKGVALKDVAVKSAQMVGAWIPGSPFEATPHHVKYDEAEGVLVVQLQVRPADNCTRCVCVELVQHDEGVGARILWARYSFDWPVGSDFEKEGYGGAPIAPSPTMVGYGINTLEFETK